MQRNVSNARHRCILFDANYRGAENDKRENDGSLKLQDVKMQYIKLQDIDVMF